MRSQYSDRLAHYPGLFMDAQAKMVQIDTQRIGYGGCLLFDCDGSEELSNLKLTAVKLVDYSFVPVYLLSGKYKIYTNDESTVGVLQAVMQYSISQDKPVTIVAVSLNDSSKVYLLHPETEEKCFYIRKLQLHDCYVENVINDSTQDSKLAKSLTEHLNQRQAKQSNSGESAVWESSNGRSGKGEILSLSDTIVRLIRSEFRMRRFEGSSNEQKRLEKLLHGSILFKYRHVHDKLPPIEHIQSSLDRLLQLLL